MLVFSTSRMVWGAERGLLGLAPLLGQLGVALTLASPQGALSEAWLAAGFPHVEFPVADRHGLRDSDGGRPGPRVVAREVSETVGTARRLARLAKAFASTCSNSGHAAMPRRMNGSGGSSTICRSISSFSIENSR